MALSPSPRRNLKAAVIPRLPCLPSPGVILSSSPPLSQSLGQVPVVLALGHTALAAGPHPAAPILWPCFSREASGGGAKVAQNPSSRRMGWVPGLVFQKHQ